MSQSVLVKLVVVQLSMRLVCSSHRNLMYGRCTRSAAGSSSLPATVSGNNMRISSTDRILRSIRLSFFRQTLRSLPIVAALVLTTSYCPPSGACPTLWRVSRSARVISPGRNSTTQRTSIFLQAVPSVERPTATLLQLPVHFFWNAL